MKQFKSVGLWRVQVGRRRGEPPEVWLLIWTPPGLRAQGCVGTLNPET